MTVSITDLIKTLEEIQNTTTDDLPVYLDDEPLEDGDLQVHDSPVWGIWRLVIGKGR